MAATVLEKLYGSSFAYEHIYTSPFSIVLWSLLALSGIIHLISCRTWKQFFTFSLHVSFVLILAGALTTHITGKQGRMHIRTGEAISAYETADGVREALPFMVTLEVFKLEYYAGTSAPMDYISHISIQDGEKISDAVVSMNNIHKYNGYIILQRFHRLCADTALGEIDNAHRRFAVERVVDKAQIRKQILDFLAFEELETAEHLKRNPVRGELLFERTGERVEAH